MTMKNKNLATIQGIVFELLESDDRCKKDDFIAEKRKEQEHQFRAFFRRGRD